MRAIWISSAFKAATLHVSRWLRPRRWGKCRHDGATSSSFPGATAYRDYLDGRITFEEWVQTPVDAVTTCVECGAEVYR